MLQSISHLLIVSLSLCTGAVSSEGTHFMPTLDPGAPLTPDIITHSENSIALEEEDDDLLSGNLELAAELNKDSDMRLELSLIHI